MKKIVLVGVAVLFLAGCTSDVEITSAGDVETVLQDAGIPCKDIQVSELPWDSSTLLMVCSDSNAQGETYSFLIWKSNDSMKASLAETCDSAFSSASANELIATTDNVIAESDSLLVDVERISEAMRGTTSTWFEYCSSIGFNPTIEEITEQTYEVQDVVGTDYVDAKSLLESDRLLVLRVFEKSEKPEGIIVRMVPAAGTTVVEKTAITLYVSSGN